MNELPVAELTAELTAVLTSVFDTLGPLVARTVELLSSPVRTAELTVLDDLAIDALNRPDGLIVGAGFVVAPGILADREYWLQWWSDYNTPRTGVPEQLVVETDPRSESFNDYTRLPWFAVPARTGRRHLTGPYVDYLCTDEYTLTYTVPVVARGTLAGIVGADVYARAMVSLLAPRLEACSSPVTVVNANGRVLASTSTELQTGDLLHDETTIEQLSRLPQGDSAQFRTSLGAFTQCADLPVAIGVGPA